MWCLLLFGLGVLVLKQLTEVALQLLASHHVSLGFAALSLQLAELLLVYVVYVAVVSVALLKLSDFGLQFLMADGRIKLGWLRGLVLLNQLVEFVFLSLDADGTSDAGTPVATVPGLHVSLSVL